MTIKERAGRTALSYYSQKAGLTNSYMPVFLLFQALTRGSRR